MRNHEPCRLSASIPSLALSSLALGIASCAAKGGYSSIYVENDAFGFGNSSDNNYTHGTQFDHVLPLEESPEWAQKFADWGTVGRLSLSSAQPTGDRPEALDDYSVGLQYGMLDALESRDSDPNDQIGTEFSAGYDEGFAAAQGVAFRQVGVPMYTDRIKFSLGQQIYTPNDITRKDVIEDSRPYAGWLYGTLALIRNRYDSQTLRRRDSQSTVGMTLGVIGPASGAGDVQEWFHDVRDHTEPEGWSNQLDNEPGLILEASREDRLNHQELGPWELDSISHIGARVGNISTRANMGTFVRLGPSLPRDFGIEGIPTGLARTVETVDLYGQNSGFYVFLGVDGRFVLRDIFLDGNTFEDSHSVDKEPLVADLKAGLALWYQRIQVSFTYGYRTEEYDEQDDPHAFGSISLRWW